MLFRLLRFVVRIGHRVKEGRKAGKQEEEEEEEVPAIPPARCLVHARLVISPEPVARGRT